MLRFHRARCTDRVQEAVGPCFTVLVSHSVRPVQTLPSQVSPLTLHSAALTRYYVNDRTGTSTWEKPWALRDKDVDADCEWRETVDVEGNRMFYQASTGRTSYYSLEQGALLVQRNFRKHQGKVMGTVVCGGS